MVARFAVVALLIHFLAGPVPGQNGDSAGGQGVGRWQRAGASGAADQAAGSSSSTAPAKADRLRVARRDPPSGEVPLVAVAPGPIARVSSGNGTLPSEHGQIYREYDISPYTRRVTSTKRPEQAIIEWILRETGYEVWHSETVAVLNADDRTLRVYHTPRMQAIVAEIVNRFVASGARTEEFGLRVVTVSEPNWRSRAQGLVRPMQCRTPGVQAWLMQREDAAMLLAQLRRRADFLDHCSPHLLVNSGQSTVVSTLRGRSYRKHVQPRRDALAGFDMQVAQVDEGFLLELSPLLSADGRTIDAAVQCHIDQVERLIPVTIALPSATAPHARTEVEVPQMAHFRFSERFRWPADKVLLIDLGMAALPIPAEATSLIPGVPLPLAAEAPRANLLVFVEAKAQAASEPAISRVGQRSSPLPYKRH